ncbi:hypothetical protein VFPPC_11623 [Pochonia chlamydosporia 170]|uniref:Uncharacterized protein n=1 Tax=Pochonia chlamydosporia 170 TaxID=1380566 RepID=A0A179FVK5_METCM|nr:hypothetical protein VFPPC_11623 [Pochonia chlamydosporia 170]OAQ69268.1 hypothetical protein VFPPC_11623 [Pochonia chlamydosporia 170]
MTISCQLSTLYDQPIEGIFVEFKCVEHPQNSFEGYSDQSGMIDEWFSSLNRELQSVPCTPGEDLHWQMRFHLQPFFGETYFPEIWNTLWVPKEEDSHVVIKIDKNMYAVIRDDILHGATLRTETVSIHGPRSPRAIHNLPGSGDVEIRVTTPLPYDRISGFNEPVCVSAGPDVIDAAPWLEEEPKKRKRGVPRPEQLRRSARLAQS